jgi:hypothetical protein
MRLGVASCRGHRRRPQALEELSAIPVGPLVYVVDLGFWKGLCHGGLALLVLGSQVTSGVTATCFFGQFWFRPMRGEACPP